VSFCPAVDLTLTEMRTILEIMDLVDFGTGTAQEGMALHETRSEASSMSGSARSKVPSRTRAPTQAGAEWPLPNAQGARRSADSVNGLLRFAVKGPGDTITRTHRHTDKCFPVGSVVIYQPFTTKSPEYSRGSYWLWRINGARPHVNDCSVCREGSHMETTHNNLSGIFPGAVMATIY
jgi:hypothetical protein